MKSLGTSDEPALIDHIIARDQPHFWLSRSVGDIRMRNSYAHGKIRSRVDAIVRGTVVAGATFVAAIAPIMLGIGGSRFSSE